MAHSVEIAGVRYVPSGIAGAAIGYTSDYVTRLAREGKIAATRVGRQWFVDPISLENFYANANRKKKIRQEKLRLERVRERKEKSSTGTKFFEIVHTPLVVEATKNGSTIGALLKTSGVVVAGVLAGMIFYYGPTSSSDYIAAIDIDGELASAAIEFHEFITQPAAVVVTEERTADTATEENTQTTLSETDAPVSSAQGVVVIPDSDTATDDLASVKESFSDEVTITRDAVDPDTGIITPVFRERTGDQYRFLLVPIAEGSEP